jgi:hypothetical protein
MPTITIKNEPTHVSPITNFPLRLYKKQESRELGALAIDELSRMIQMHLWVDSKWISEDRELEEQYTRLDIAII